MDTGGPSVAKLLLHAVAREIQPTFIKKRAELVRSGNPDHDRGRIGQFPETLFTLEQSLFGFVSVGDIGNYGNPSVDGIVLAVRGLSSAEISSSRQFAIT
jgi:hypothetical protein